MPQAGRIPGEPHFKDHCLKQAGTGPAPDRITALTAVTPPPPGALSWDLSVCPPFRACPALPPNAHATTHARPPLIAASSNGHGKGGVRLLLPRGIAGLLSLSFLFRFLGEVGHWESRGGGGLAVLGRMSLQWGLTPCPALPPGVRMSAMGNAFSSRPGSLQPALQVEGQVRHKAGMEETSELG